MNILVCTQASMHSASHYLELEQKLYQKQPTEQYQRKIYTPSSTILFALLLKYKILVKHKHVNNVFLIIVFH